MTTQEELNLFLTRSNELIESKYILADIKIVGLLKSIAVSKTILALFENCLKDFDYAQEKKKCFVKTGYGDRYSFAFTGNSRNLLALVFNILIEIDSKRINLGDFINKYFYQDGSFSSGYSAFIAKMIIPFRDTVKSLMEMVIEGTVQNPLEVLVIEEEKKLKEALEAKKIDEENKKLSKKVYGESVKAVKEILLADKKKVKEKIKNAKKLKEMELVIDMLANVIVSEDKDAIIYATTAYKFMAKNHPFIMCKRAKKVSKLVGAIINAI